MYLHNTVAFPHFFQKYYYYLCYYSHLQKEDKPTMRKWVYNEVWMYKIQLVGQSSKCSQSIGKETWQIVIKH